MSGAITAIFLVLTVAGAWFGCAAFSRLATPLDRLHCVAFVNAVCGTTLTVAVFAADGVSVRSVKMLLLLVAALTSGAAMAHATGRALTLRGRDE